MSFFNERFEDLEDPRTGNATRHDLLEMLTIAVTASICGAESWSTLPILQSSGSAVSLLPAPRERPAVA